MKSKFKGNMITSLSGVQKKIDNFSQKTRANKQEQNISLIPEKEQIS